MKKRICLLVACVFIFFGCSEEESIEELQLENATITSNGIQNNTTSQGFAAAFICDPDWTPPIYEPGIILPDEDDNPFPVLKLEKIHITYSDEVALGDIDCIRQEYFRTYGCLQMAILQPNNPRHDIWVDLQDTGACTLPTGSTTTGQTQPLATSPDDDRVCKGPPSVCNGD